MTPHRDYGVVAAIDRGRLAAFYFISQRRRYPLASRPACPYPDSNVAYRDAWQQAFDDVERKAK